MPQTPPHKCARPGCVELVTSAYCPAHTVETKRAREQQRESAYKRGYNTRWRKYRAAYLARYPLCIECERAGRIAPAAEVDHITPHRGDRRLFWDTGNHQPLCKSCHSRKTAREVGFAGAHCER